MKWTEAIEILRSSGRTTCLMLEQWPREDEAAEFIVYDPGLNKHFKGPSLENAMIRWKAGMISAGILAVSDETWYDGVDEVLADIERGEVAELLLVKNLLKLVEKKGNK